MKIEMEEKGGKRGLGVVMWRYLIDGLFEIILEVSGRMSESEY